MKIIIFLCFSLMGASCREGTEMNLESFGETIYTIIKSGEMEKLDQYFMTEEDYRTLIDKSGIPIENKRELEQFLSKWDGYKERYMDNFKFDREIEGISSDDLLSTELDSITYDYLILYKGKNDYVKWPDSKKYQMDPTKVIKASIEIYFSDKTKNYKLGIDPMDISGTWKLDPSGNKMRIELLN